MKTDIILSDSVMQRGENAANLSLTSVIFRKIEICFRYRSKNALFGPS